MSLNGACENRGWYDSAEDAERRLQSLDDNGIPIDKLVPEYCETCKCWHVVLGVRVQRPPDKRRKSG